MYWTALIINTRAATLAVLGALLFNLMPLSLRNNNYGDIAMFKYNLDIYLDSIPDH